ncbi:hypothetical protein [Kordiimonas aquimaris]|uniref:hypothetical protein n=1 Tax=Kordiimonas aquimaris TaxID=707591 RepID=UPI0021D215FE|nr:hypothetical protein [Kordiimonas aquimaris]
MSIQPRRETQGKAIAAIRQQQIAVRIRYAAITSTALLMVLMLLGSGRLIGP